MECPVCGSKYNLQKKEIPQWKVYADITLSVIIDFGLISLWFVLLSFLLGSLMVYFGVQFEITSNPLLMGAMVLIVILGFVSFIFGLTMIARDNIFFLNGINCNGDNAIMVFFVIGAIVVLCASVYWIYVTLNERIEHHQRRVGVKQFVVRDFTRGIDLI